MTTRLYLPVDAVTGDDTDFDRAADFLELAAFFAEEGTVATSDLANSADIGASEDYADLQDEMESGNEDLVSGTVNRIDHRSRVLRVTYPFCLDEGGDILSLALDEHEFGQAAYVLSLVLSNLRSMSPVLDQSPFHPEDAEVRTMREHFQFFATAALAAEIHGDAWSFGFPRPDHSPFLGKLREIWHLFGDGNVGPQAGAPAQPKDDQVDVFAARLHADRLPGYLIAAAQVATGKDADQKSLKGHLSAFKSRWFATQPVTDFIAYMIVPFAMADSQFVDWVRTMGNVLHRLRLPLRVADAARLIADGRTIEGYDRLPDAARWVAQYRSHGARAEVCMPSRQYRHPTQ